MRWEDERYVRIYTRDTAEWVALGWEAQCLFMAILRKVDRAGILTLGKTGVRGIAGLVGAPLDLVERALPVLLDDGCVHRTETGLVLPNFISAQETPLSDKARQREKRERDRAHAMRDADVTKRDAESRTVTDSHAESREVTPRHAASLRAVPDHAGSPLPPVREMVPTAPGGQLGLVPVVGQPASRRQATAPKQDKPDAVPAHERYGLAYAAGMTDATGDPFTPPTDSQARLIFRTVLPAHALDDSAQPLRGDDLLAWIRVSASEYRRSIKPAEARFNPGFKPSHWKTWLDAGKPGAPRAQDIGRQANDPPPLDGRVVERPLPPDEPAERRVLVPVNLAELARGIKPTGAP